MNAELATPSPATFGTASGPLVDTVRLANGHWVAASDTQVWLHREIIPGQIPLSEHISEPGDAERMRQLMAGILVAGLRQSTATRAPYAVSWQRHVWSLASSYQTTHATPSVMRRVADRFDAENRPELADWCRHVADEESGHDELALRDLMALGIQAAEFVNEIRPASDRKAICQGAFETVALMRIGSDYPGDEAIEALVTRFRAATA